MEYLKTLNNLTFSDNTKTVFVGLLFSECYEKNSEIDISQHRQAGVSICGMGFDDMHQETTFAAVWTRQT